jgi:hypothetical protein
MRHWTNEEESWCYAVMTAVVAQELLGVVVVAWALDMHDHAPL